MNGTRALLAQAARLRAMGGAGAVATLIARRGSAAARPGERVWLGPDGSLWGAVTLGGCADARIHEALEQVRESGEARVLRVLLGEEAYELGLSCSGELELLLEPLPDADLVAALGVAQGRLEEGGRVHLLHVFGEPVRLLAEGEVVFGPPLGGKIGEVDFALSEAVALESSYGGRAFLHPLEPPPQLFIVGAGAVAEALVGLARPLGFYTTVVDEKSERLLGKRFSGADRLLVVGAAEVPIPPAAHIIITVHNYAYEVEVLRRALGARTAYIGLMAGRRRGRAVLQFLEDTGVPAPLLQRIHTPAGLDLGGSTPAGIALSIMSEIGAGMYSGSGKALKSFANLPLTVV